MPKTTDEQAAKQAATNRSKKRQSVPQSDFPIFTLEKALAIPRALYEHFAGSSTAPHDVAFAIDMAPTSGTWRNLCGSAAGYGLTEGSAFASTISLTPLGRRIVAPIVEGDDAAAMMEALQKPRIMREFLQKYDRAKLPRADIGQNVIAQLGLPKDRAVKAFDVIKENGDFTGVIRATATGHFVAMASRLPTSRRQAYVDPSGDDELDDDPQPTSPDGEKVVQHPAVTRDSAPVAPAVDPDEDARAKRVFISHGKNKAIVDQLKDLLAFGEFEPVVSVEKETTSIPVPEKVFDDMRRCGAGVIHVSGERELIDNEGQRHNLINQNVLIEIGAAMALYKRKFVLLTEKGLSLPSNLQGLYRCEYEGSKLDGDATMKLLKTFKEFKN